MEDIRIHVMIDGEQQDLSLDKWNKNGGASSFAKEFPNAEVRMRDNSGQDYSVPISQFSSAAQKGLHMFTYSTTPAKTINDNKIAAEKTMSSLNNQIYANAPRQFVATSFNRTVQQPKKLAEKEIEPIQVNPNKPITTQLPNATLYNVQQDADKEFDTSIAPKIDKLVQQNYDKGLSSMKGVADVHPSSPSGMISNFSKMGAEFSKNTDYSSVVDNIKNYISSKQKAGKGTGSGIDPRTERIMSRTIDYLAQKQMPKSTMEYILRNMYDNSLIGTFTGIAKSSTQQQVEQRGNELYKPSKATQIASGVGSLLLDSPLFGAGGKLASGITKLGVKGAQKIIADKLIEASGKTLAKDIAMQQAARVMASNAPKAVFSRIAQNMASTAINLGGYNVTSNALGQTNAVAKGNQDKFDLGQIAKEGLWGAATGAASGILGGTVGHLSRNLSGVGKALSDFGGYVGDSSVFAGMSALQKYANGEPVDLTEDAIDSFATLGATKIGHIGSAIRNWSKASAEERKQMQDALNFTPEDKESLSKYGIDGNDLIGTIGKLSHQTTETHAVPGKILSENGRYVVRDAWKEETKKVEKDFDTIMKAPDIPISTKNKVLYMVKGRQVVTPMTSYNISKNGDKARLTTYDWANRPILVKDFKTDKDAKQYASRNDYDNNILRNTASVLENINDKNINSTYKNIVANNIYNAVNGGNYADLSEGEKRVVDSYNNQLGEAMKASVDEIKRTSGIDVESLLNTPRELLTPQQADAVDKYNEDFNSYKKDNDIRNDIKEALNPEYTFDDTKPHSPIERTRDKRIIEIREAIDEDRLSNDNYLDNMSSSIKSKVKEDTGVDINKALESKTRAKEEDDAIGTYIEALKKNIGADTKEEPDMETQKYIIADNFSKATENVTDIDPNNPKPEDEQKIKEYDNAKQQFGNYVEYVNNKAKQAADEAENWAKELSNKKMNGLIVTATTPLSENPIYIVDGQIVHKEDGSIDYDKSDPEIIYVDPNDGKRKMASLQNADGNFITDVNYDNYDTYVKSVRQQAEDEVRAKEQQDFDNRDQMSEGLPKNEVSPTEEIEQNVSEQPNTQEQIQPVPLDENGKPVYHKAPIESTLKDMRDKGADDDTISEFAQMRVDALTKEQSKLDKQKPAPSDDFSVFQQNKAALQSQKQDVSDQLDYWNSVYNSLQQTEQPEEQQTGQPSQPIEQQPVVEQQPDIPTQQNTVQQPIESAPTKTIKVRNRPLGPKRYYTKESKEMGAPTSLREAVMRAIAEGDYKFQWKDNTSDKTKGLGSHLGYGEKERKQMIGFTASKENGGMPPEVVAEKIKGELGEQFPNATDQDIFDEILDIFGTYGGSRKAIWNAAKEQHGVDQNAEEEEYYRDQLEAEVYYNHMSPDEYEAYEYDYIPSYLEERYNSDTDDDINERLSTFADIINSENNENNSEGTSTVHGQLPEREGLQPGTEGSDSVLPESGSIQYGNDSESNEIRENSTDKADEVGNDDVHGQFVPATDEGIKAAREFDIKLQNAKLALENAQKEYDKKLKSINDRNGLFGDTKDDGTSMFGDTSDFSKGTVDKSLEPYRAKIEAAKREIDKLNESRDAFIKQQETQKNISQEEKKVDTNPTEAQKEAGNYKKGHVNIDGMNFTIENPKGSTRSGKDSDGEEWHTVMNNTYGYIKGTKGVDGDHIDMYLSDNPTEGNVYVIDQINPKTGEFDEHKVMYGFNSENEAKDAYLSNYSKGWKGLGKITEVSKDEFKKWIDSSTRKTKPFSDYKLTKEREKKNSALDNTTDTVETQSGNGNDTATPENTVSVSKDKNNTLNNKELEDNYINEIFDKAKRGSNSNISIDKSKTFPEDLQVGFKINGEESNIGACLRLTDNIQDEPIFKATYFNDALSYDELSNAIDRFNEDKGETIATDDGDSKYIYFPTVDDAIEFNDSIENKLDEPLETTNEKRMSEIVEELSDVESRMMELEDNDLTDSSEYGNLKAKMGDLESEYKGLKTINEESNRIQNGINEPSPTYKTGSGKKITFTPIQFNLFTNNAPIKNSRDTLSGPHLDELKPGDICNVERVFSKTKSFEFYGNNKIESYEDVAYIFKNLEDEAIEHSFMVYIKNGKATVLHMCMGDFSAVMTNPAAGKYADHIIDSDEVYFVHNHPSGNLKPSAQDMKVNARMKELFGKKLKDSIIIDRKSGKFAIFDEYSSGVLDEKNNINKKEPVEVYEFNKLSFGSDSIPPTKISSSYDVAEFVSTQRLGDRKKINYLIISQAGEITADIQTPFIDFKNTKKIGDDIINKVAQFGGTQAIIYGDFELENSTPIKSINGYIQNAGVRLCDVIKIDGNNTKYDLRFKSAMDEGMAFDPNQVKPTVNNDKIKDVRFRNSSQLDAQYPSWLSGQVNDNGKHSTQISGTVKTYDKIGKWVEDTIGKDATILDASSGLGVGTESLRKQGFNVDDVEPYPSKDRIKPTYAKYDDIDKKYDVIISNAVLNVIPDDWRADVLKNMADKLNVGGKLIINVRDAKEIENQKQKIELDSPSEILVTDSKGRIRAYQKGFTEQELIKFAQDTLGKGWNVEKANNANSGIGGARAIVITRETGDKLKYRPIDKIEEEKNNISNARNKRIVAAAENLSNSLHTVLNIVHSNEIDGKKSKAKAWYDVKEDKVYLVPENNIDEADAEQSILHEVVAHKGLRKMFGEDFDNAMWDIYKSIPEEERKKIAKEASDRYDNDFVEATEEYLASMAEKGVDKPSLWKRIVSRIRELLRKVGIKLKMSDNDIKYLLWKSRRGMETDVAKEFEVKENIFGNVEHAPLEPLFRIDPKDLNGKDMQQQVELAKTVAELNEQEVGDYLERMKHQVLFEAWIDNTNPIRVFQDTIMKHYGTELPDDCDAHLAYNVMTSRAHNEKSMFQKQIYEPLIESVKKIGKYDDVVNYLIAKHGMERNALMRSKEIEALKESFEKAEKDIDSDSFKKAAEKIRYKDFSGLTGLQRELKYKETDKWEDDLSKVVLSDDYIQSFIDSFEENKDEADLAEMWALINIATDFSLETQKKYGCISQDKLDEISSMYEFYVPLRDWSDPRAEDFFDYFNTEKYEGLNMPLKKAFGRKSKAGDPIANIASMADSAIVTGNKNRVRQHLFRLVFNYPTNLAHISPVWYTEDEVSGDIQEIAFEQPEGVDYDSAFKEFKEHMDALEQSGQIYKAFPRLKVGKPIKKWQSKQHATRVKINGDDYIVYMDSSPRAAQAINGENVISSVEGLTWMKNIQNFVARNVTTRILNFIFINFFKDYTGALTYNYVYKYGSMLDFVKSTPQAARTLSEYLLTGSMSDGKYGTYLKEFLENGGETGYGNSMSYNDFVKDIKKDINTAKHPNRIQMFRWMARGLDILNRGAEDTTRFTAYISSREGGKSVMQSIKAAKEISVNFNRAGSGDKGNAVARIWYMFLNAGIQALYNTVRAFKNNPVRASLAFGTWAGIGFLNGVMQYYMTGDNDYFDIPDWVRQNNLAIKVGQTTMVSLPLALEIRPFFAIGDILAQVTFGKYHGKNAATDIATKFMESAPYNFFEGTNERDDSSIELLENTAAPSALKPFFDVFMTNRDYTGKPISKQNEFNRYVPEYKKGYKSTSDIAIRLSKLINDISGGDNARKGYLDNRFNNPAVLEYLFNNYGGGVMKQIFSSAKSAVNAFRDGKEVDVRDIPVASAVIYNFDSSKNNTNINQMYYNYINDMEESKSQDREYKKDIVSGSEPLSIGRYISKKSDLNNERKIAVISFYKSVIDKLNDERKMVPEGGDEAKNMDNKIYGLKKAMVEQLEKY